MKIGILGSGVVGQALGAGFLKHRHQVMLGTRDPRKAEVQQWLGKTPGAQAGTFAETAAFGELVILACLGGVVREVLSAAGTRHLAGKVLIDTTNPIAPAPPVEGVFRYSTGPNESLGEAVQALVPDSHVVKAFNSVGSPLMVDPHFEQGTPTMFICGNDAGAKAQVAGILQDFGWEAYDMGGIIAARAIEPLCMLWCIPGLARNEWNHAFKLLTR